MFWLNMPKGARSRGLPRDVTSFGVMPVADGKRKGCTSYEKSPSASADPAVTPRLFPAELILGRFSPLDTSRSPRFLPHCLLSPLSPRLPACSCRAFNCCAQAQPEVKTPYCAAPYIAWQKRNGYVSSFETLSFVLVTCQLCLFFTTVTGFPNQLQLQTAHTWTAGPRIQFHTYKRYRPAVLLNSACEREA